MSSRSRCVGDERSGTSTATAPLQHRAAARHVLLRLCARATPWLVRHARAPQTPRSACSSSAPSGRAEPAHQLAPARSVALLDRVLGTSSTRRSSTGGSTAIPWTIALAEEDERRSRARREPRPGRGGRSRGDRDAAALGGHRPRVFRGPGLLQRLTRCLSARRARRGARRSGSRRSHIAKLSVHNRLRIWAAPAPAGPRAATAGSGSRSGASREYCALRDRLPEPLRPRHRLPQLALR